MTDATKQCPYCMETINAEAKKCKFCGEILDPALRELEALKQQQQQMNAGPTIINNNNNNNNNNGGAGCCPTTPQVVAGPPKSRIVYIILAVFLGSLGVHNFYAGRVGAGIGQLLITLLIGWLVLPLLIVWLWVFIEICAVTRDGSGVPFN